MYTYVVMFRTSVRISLTTCISFKIINTKGSMNDYLQVSFTPDHIISVRTEIILSGVLIYNYALLSMEKSQISHLIEVIT